MTWKKSHGPHSNTCRFFLMNKCSSSVALQYVKGGGKDCYLDLEGGSPRCGGREGCEWMEDRRGTGRGR